jgi:urate oxidase
VQISSQRYGKDRVRVLRVQRGSGGIHSVFEVEVSVALEGDFSATYLRGDNAKVVPTDTMKNTVHVLAQKYLDDVLEEFPLALAHHFLETYPQVTRAVIEATSRPWDRYRTLDGCGKPHTFSGRATSLPFSRADATREATTIQSGIKEVLILNSTASSFVGYPKSEFTTLPETKDRILATKMEATWTFASQVSSFTKTNEAVVSALLDTFASEFSPSVQNTLFLMGSAALQAAPGISDIHLAMPNKHYLPIDFEPFGLENHNEIFLPTDEPHGQIEARITR